MEIKIIGSGCADCNKLYSHAVEAVKELNVDADIIKVEDLKDILILGVMQVPAIMINGKLKSGGQVLSKDKIKKLLENM